MERTTYCGRALWRPTSPLPQQATVTLPIRCGTIEALRRKSSAPL
jgi:hypothetical protein